METFAVDAAGSMLLSSKSWSRPEIEVKCSDALSPFISMRLKVLRMAVMEAVVIVPWTFAHLGQAWYRR